MIKKILIALIFLCAIIFSIFFDSNIIFKYFSNILALVLCFFILNSKTHYQQKLGWVFFLIIAPILGIIIYLTFGMTYKSKYIYKKKINSDNFINKNFADDINKNLNDNQLFLYNMTNEFINKNNFVSVLNNGNEKFDLFFFKISRAKKFIFIQYYIFNEGKLFDKLLTILKTKILEGVEVKILVDAYGSSKLSNKVIQNLKALKIDLQIFGEIISFNNLLNYRNHRKLVIIDNQYAFVGGINFSDEYYYETKKYGKLRDTHLCIEGESVITLCKSFLKDWYYITNDIDAIKYLNYKPNYNLKSNSSVQVIRSGPDMKNLKMKDIYFKLFNDAKDSILIMTPYLIPDYEIIKSLQIASLNGIEIKIITPNKPDNIFVHSITRSYYETLLDYNIKIYEYKVGFVHSKVIIIDQTISIVGSTNLDFRSFNLNFELAALIFDEKINRDLRVQYELDLENCFRVDQEYWSNRSFLKKVYSNIVQIFSPLM